MRPLFFLSLCLSLSHALALLSLFLSLSRARSLLSLSLSLSRSLSPVGWAGLGGASGEMVGPFRARRRGNDNLALLLLAGQVMQIGIENIPPATLFLFGLNTVVHLDLLAPLGIYPPPIQASCLLPAAIVEGQAWLRLFWPVILHTSSYHLYYNMVSLLYKGRKLEPRLGTERMLMLTALFGVGGNMLHTGLAYLLHLAGFYDSYVSCSVGFSGVLFALKLRVAPFFLVLRTGSYLLKGNIPIHTIPEPGSRVGQSASVHMQSPHTLISENLFLDVFSLMV
ncbi:uncharacterized protein MONBRDRAFT_25699 [Monosiga brevicollis MX1]|uniref:Peptidase S54 rhomboid domain-containing protein n=1 Tax=Monosiga brevicollis TaxID=81824 RepID=A9V059_MONBE|nr:uncharacterized protein MONBRDRAFT_25699 [Monosiga brevicollis MX1]EDQ89100.1 predicted protein [Monosiga brevicollis MX1]|eukprot:XP_001746205.1 hypothetical protein [Monosiga brevicollis MX1]